MYLTLQQLAREQIGRRHDEAERAKIVRTVRAARRTDRKARRAVLRATVAQAQLDSLHL